MKKHYYPIACALSLALTLPVSAATLINVGTSGTGSVKTSVNETVNGVTHSTSYDSNGANVSGSTGLDTSVHVNGTTNTSDNSSNGNASAGVNVNTNVNTGSQGTTHPDNGNTTVDTDNNSDTSVSGKATVFTRSDFDTSDTAALTTTMTAADVNTSDDLRSFVQSSMQSDDNISAVSFADNDVSVSYKDHGRLIGFIPVTIDTMVTANADGTITVNYPWYGFLVAKDRESLQSDLDTNVGAMIRADRSSWTAHRMAQIAARLSAALKAHFEGSSMPEDTSSNSGSLETSGSVTGSSTSATSND